MNTHCHIDFESFSLVNLKTAGLDKYARDYRTGIYCMAWAFDDDEPQIWLPGQTPPEALCEYIIRGGVLVAHNAAFERLMWRHQMPRHGWPTPRLEQWQCSAVRARAHGLPGGLDDAARCLGLPIAKHADGQRLIKTYSANGTAWSCIPANDQYLWIDYCLQDVVLERAVASCLRELTDFEWAEYHCNERINDRGVPVDVAMAEAAIEYGDEVRADVDARIATLTKGAVANARARKDRDAWLRRNLSPQAIELLASPKTEGALVFDEDARNALLELDIPSQVRDFITLVDEAGGATLGKYKAISNRQHSSRIRGTLVFNGAGQTGRFSSTAVQWQNLRRDNLPDPDQTILDLIDGYAIDDVTDTLARLVRNVITHPDGLSWCDWSSIEGRVAPWLAKSTAGERKLDMYRKGIDPYVVNAATLYRVPEAEVTKDQRQRGKVMELACGFLGGAGALQSMGRGYGLILADDEATRLRDAWRTANPWAMAFGQELERAAMRAVMHPGEWHGAGRVAYACDGTWLWCRLPSTRLIAYYQPKLEGKMTPWGEEATVLTASAGGRVKTKHGDWRRLALWPGMLLENITQATAADLLREALLACEDDGVPVVLHVHDEIIAIGECREQLQSIMLEQRDWAAGLPLAADAGGGARYGK